MQATAVISCKSSLVASRHTTVQARPGHAGMSAFYAYPPPSPPNAHVTVGSAPAANASASCLSCVVINTTRHARKCTCTNCSPAAIRSEHLSAIVTAMYHGGRNVGHRKSHARTTDHNPPSLLISTHPKQHMHFNKLPRLHIQQQTM